MTPTHSPSPAPRPQRSSYLCLTPEFPSADRAWFIAEAQAIVTEHGGSSHVTTNMAGATVIQFWMNNRKDS